jgi:hypothetical protein
MDTRWIPPGMATQILDKIDVPGLPDTAAKSCLAIRPIIHHLVTGCEEALHGDHGNYNFFEYSSQFKFFFSMRFASL